MTYHVINVKTHKLTSLLANEVLNMQPDAEDRIIVYGVDQEKYYLLADVDLMKD